MITSFEGFAGRRVMEVETDRDWVRARSLNKEKALLCFIVS